MKTTARNNSNSLRAYNNLSSLPKTPFKKPNSGKVIVPTATRSGNPRPLGNRTLALPDYSANNASFHAPEHSLPGNIALARVAGHVINQQATPLLRKCVSVPVSMLNKLHNIFTNLFTLPQAKAFEERACFPHPWKTFIRGEETFCLLPRRKDSSDISMCFPPRKRSWWDFRGENICINYVKNFFSLKEKVCIQRIKNWELSRETKTCVDRNKNQQTEICLAPKSWRIRYEDQKCVKYYKHGLFDTDREL